jgi:wyosine [tRNA(Phe)-imidazoG37] synthetase (radical SAM superfamily)
MKLLERKPAHAPFAYPGDLLGNRLVYLAISPRARGLFIGVNVNPDAACSWGCVYCDVNRSVGKAGLKFDAEIAAAELKETLALVNSPRLRELEPYATLPNELLGLRHVALTGEGEPTDSPDFLQAAQMATHVRARGTAPFFKIVLITNAANLLEPPAQSALSLFTRQDEVWAKLDAGTQARLDLVNQSGLSIETITRNIQETAKRRPVIVQSLFCSIDNRQPGPEDITAYAERLRSMKEAGAEIPLVQIYSARTPTPSGRAQHLPLKRLSEIATLVRNISGLRVEVF